MGVSQEQADHQYSIEDHVATFLIDAYNRARRAVDQSVAAVQFRYHRWINLIDVSFA